jgi:hypothetical protein
MKDRLQKCEQYRDSRSNPSVSEKGKTFQLENIEKREVACIKIDDCVFKQADGIKCDYLFEVASKRKLFYVELKGSDILEGIRQIHETLKQTRSFYPGWIYEARVIASGRIPRGISDRREHEKLRSICNGGKVTVHHKNLHIEPL